MLFCFTKTLVGGCPRTPETTVARHVHGCGAPEQDHLMVHEGHADPASLSAVASAPPPLSASRSSAARMSNSSVGSPKTGGTPTSLGVEFVRYGGSYGLGFRQTAPQTPRMAVRAVSGLDRVLGGSMTRMAATQSAQDSPTGGSSSPRRSRPSSRLAGSRGITSAWSSATAGAALGRGSRDEVRGMEHLAVRRPRGGPETQGSEGAQPPASLRRGRTECGPKEYAACLR